MSIFKLEKTVTENGVVTQTIYLGGFQYKYSENQNSQVEEEYPEDEMEDIHEPTEPPLYTIEPDPYDPPDEESSYLSGELPMSRSISSANATSFSMNILQFFPTAEGYFDNIKQKYVYQYKDHLGNIRLSYAKNKATNVLEILEENNYYPFGLKHEGYNVNPASDYKYKYNGKELQDELSLNLSDFGSRNYDASIGRWNVIDPQAEKYYDKSSYNYTLNNPMYYVDPNGEDIYLHYFLRNNNHNGKKDPNADKMFMAAAMTRAVDFLNSGEGGSDDILIMKGIDNMSDIGTNIESDITEYSETYGKTAEFGLWSHSGIDGPFREDSKGSYDQLSVKDWGKIDFNWAKGANAMFYGCRSGFDTGEWSEAGNKKSFVQNLSSMSNMEDVKVWGQTQRSWPSPFTDTRVYTPNIGASNHGYPTYMVGSKIGITSFNTVYFKQTTYGYPMSIYQNGKLTEYSHQSGTKK